jgi:hypothetical protein
MASVAQAVPAVVAGTGYDGYATAPAPVYGYPGHTVIVQSAPPAPIHESVPGTREGYIWAPGHYVWDNGRYAWRGGEWMPARSGYAWQAAHWEQRNDGSWYLVGGNWVQTDNVAAMDDGRRGPWGDRDRDGVINRDDRYPRDWNRR